MKVLALFVTFFLLVTSSCAFHVVEFCPDTYLEGDADEYLVVEGYGDLDGLTISDGEGGFRFPVDARSNGRVTVAKEGRAYEKVYGVPPNSTYLTPQLPSMMSSVGDLFYWEMAGMRSLSTLMVS